MSTTWKIINYENGKPNHGKNLISLKIDNKEITNQNTVANIFNNYFLPIAKSLNSGNNKQTNTTEPNPVSCLINSFYQPFPKMSWHNASTHEIEKIINPLNTKLNPICHLLALLGAHLILRVSRIRVKSLKSKNTGGYDEISTHILKLNTPYIISLLTYICNAVLNTSTFPDRLKYAIIKPIFKKGDDQDITNYRPISLLTSFSKVIEKLIYARLLDHITTNSILVNEQYGFRTRCSNELATFSLINNILTAMNNNLKIGGIFCDLQKGFDCVNHEILLNKLEFYVIQGKFKTLIESYLTGRYQKVTLNTNTTTNSSSKWGLMNNGVPQGSILGPLFFLFYKNDLPKIITKNNSIVLLLMIPVH